MKEEDTIKEDLERIAPDLNLPRIAGAIQIACLFIVLNEFSERFAYYGGSVSLL